jgi:hypothetical protein
MKRLAFAAAVLAAAASVGRASAGNHDYWSDPAGDSGSSPDLTQVSMQSDDAGNVTFRLTYGNRSTLGADDRVQIYLDTDDNDSTGTNGFDYGIALTAGETVLKRWADGWVDTPATTFSSSGDGRSVTVNRSELGNATKLAFQVSGDLLSGADTAVDWAPDASNRVFVYWVVGPSVEQLVTVTPKKLQAGAQFRVLVPFVRLENGGSVPAEKLACAGTLNGVRLAVHTTAIACTWWLTKSAHGKRFSYTIAATNNGVTSKFGPYSARVP